mmetsp:Transcript_4041/g.9369  ORF Transcript_4041/g.9369 Transcript_4041/m.9369 type:complete len:603 (+) Transcript_4041:51-1859(+)
MEVFNYTGQAGQHSIDDDVQRLIVHEPVTALPDGFCYGMKQLTRVIFLGQTCRAIGDDAFNHCVYLACVVLPCSLEFIGENTFSECYSLVDVFLPHGLKRIGRFAFSCCSLSSIEIPSTVEVIEEGAFQGCGTLASITLLEGLKIVGKESFLQCESLPSIKLPSTVHTVGEGAFSQCNSLVECELPRLLNNIGQGAFDDGCTLTRVDNPVEAARRRRLSPVEVVFEEGLQSLENSALTEYRHSVLARASIPFTVETIDVNTFERCSLLVEVVLSEGLRSIRERAFEYCCSLQAFSLPSTVETVEERAFAQCERLVSVEIPKGSVARLGRGVFCDCTCLLNMKIPTLMLRHNCLTVHSWWEDDETIGKGRAAYDSDELLQDLMFRFDDCPFHEKCYFASTTSANDLQREISQLPAVRNGQREDYKDILVDRYGMTPFHILLSAAKRRKDLLSVLLDVFPPCVLGWENKQGVSALDYLSARWFPESKEMMAMALQRWMIDWLSHWGIPAWQSDMSSRAEEILNEEYKAKRDHLLRVAYEQMASYERIAMVSVLEMSLWKLNLAGARFGPKRVAVDRASSRSRCGASFVIPSVLSFLGDKSLHYN